MFDSVTPYGDIFDDSRNDRNTKIIRKGQCLYEAQGDLQGKYHIIRLLSTDPKLYLNIKNQPGQIISEQK